MDSKKDATQTKSERYGLLIHTEPQSFQKLVQAHQNYERALCVFVHERPEVSVIFPCDSWLHSAI